MQIEQIIGNQIREFRKARGLKLDDLAKNAGISKALLSKIENARVSSPISTYSKVAAALGVSISDFIREEPGSRYVIIRKNERKLVSRRGTAHGYQFESLGYKWPNKQFSPFLITYFPRPKNAPLPDFTFEGEEFIYLLEGDLEVFHGGDRHHLTPGDCIFLDASVSHGGRAVGKKKAVALLMSIPKKGSR